MPPDHSSGYLSQESLMQYKHDLDLLVKSRKDQQQQQHRVVKQKSSSLKLTKGHQQQQKAKFKSSIQSPVLDPGGATFPGKHYLLVIT